MARYFEEKSLIKFIDKHTNDDMTLNDDISCILEDMKTEDVISREDFVKLSEKFDKLYLAKCEEVNLLKAELEERKGE